MLTMDSKGRIFNMKMYIGKLSKANACFGKNKHVLMKFTLFSFFFQWLNNVCIL